MTPPRRIWIRGSSSDVSRRARARFCRCISMAVPRTWTPFVKLPRDITYASWKMRRKHMPRAIALSASGRWASRLRSVFIPRKIWELMERVARSRPTTHRQTARYDHEFPGYNYRMQGFQGAVSRVKLRRLRGWTQKRREIAGAYRRMLEGVCLQSWGRTARASPRCSAFLPH